MFEALLSQAKIKPQHGSHLFQETLFWFRIHLRAYSIYRRNYDGGVGWLLANIIILCFLINNALISTATNKRTLGEKKPNIWFNLYYFVTTKYAFLFRFLYEPDLFDLRQIY